MSYTACVSCPTDLIFSPLGIWILIRETHNKEFGENYSLSVGGKERGKDQGEARKALSLCGFLLELNKLPLRY